jgi:hypothetical protein
MKELADKTAKGVIGALFFPAQAVTVQRLGILAWVVIGGVLFGTVALAEPHIRELVSEHTLGVRCLAVAIKERGKEYCDFALVLFQCLIASVIGGIAITDDFVASWQRLAQSIEEGRTEILSAQEEALKSRLISAYTECMSLWQTRTWRNGLGRLIRAFHIMNDCFITVGHRLPKFYSSLFVFRLGASFPKGLYGVLALILFEGVLAAQVVKTYFDYTPVCP